MPRARRRGPRGPPNTSKKAEMERQERERELQQQQEEELQWQHALRLAELRCAISQPEATHKAPLFETPSQSGASCKEEFEKRLQETRDRFQDSTEGHHELEWRDHVRWELWREALHHQQYHQGKVLPSSDEVYWAQYCIRAVFLVGRPQEEWETELSGLVQTEIQLEDSYRALQWFMAQLEPGAADGSPTEGMGYGGVGLFHPGMHENPGFGSGTEWRKEQILDLRYEEMRYIDDDWYMEELEFLVEKEWELEQAYKKLFDNAPQLGLSPIAWDCPTGGADSREDGEELMELEPEVLPWFPVMTAEEEAAMLKRAWQMLNGQEGPSEGSEWPGEEDTLPSPQEDVPPAGVLATGQSAVGLCPLPELCPEDPGADLQGLLPPQPQVDFNPVPAPPAEALAAGQSTANPCPPPTVCPEDPGEDLQGPLPSPQGDSHPAEELATGQSTANLCPPPTLCPEDPGEDLQGPLPSSQGDSHPAEALATGQSAVGLCPPSLLYPESPGEDPCVLFSPQPIPQPQVDFNPVPTPPAEALAAGQSTANLCPPPTVCTEDPGEDLQGPLPSSQGESHPAEALATGQSAAGLCPPPHLCPEGPGQDRPGLLTPHDSCFPLATSPAEALATGQGAAGLCPPFPFRPADPGEDPHRLPQQPPAHPAEELATGQSAAGLCPHPDLCPDDPGQDRQWPLPSPPEEMAPVPVHPAEELATGQRAAGLCPPLLLCPEDPSEDPQGLLPQLPTALPGATDALLLFPQVDINPVPAHPAEELAAGQSAAGLCPPTLYYPTDPGNNHPGLHAQQPTTLLRMEDAILPSPHGDTFPTPVHPAEELATGQSAAGLCPHPDLCPDDPGKDRQGPLPSPHDNPTPMHRSPAEALAPGQSIASLCPSPRSLVLEVSGTVVPRVSDTPGEGTGGTSPHQPDRSPAGGTGATFYSPPAVHRSRGYPSDRGLTPRSKRRSPGARLLPTDYGPRRLLHRLPLFDPLGSNRVRQTLEGGGVSRNDPRGSGAKPRTLSQRPVLRTFVLLWTLQGRCTVGTP